MFEAIETDGIVTVSQTDECAFYVQYDNYLGAGDKRRVYQLDGVTIEIAEDNAVTGVCVPYPLAF